MHCALKSSLKREFILGFHDLFSKCRITQILTITYRSNCVIVNLSCVMFTLTLTSLRSLVFPNKILSISVVCSIILSQSLIRKYITIRTSHRSRISTRSLEQLILNSSIIFIKIPPWNIFYPVSLKNSGHVTQFAEYLLHILHSISSWIPFMLCLLCSLYT